MTNGPIHDNVNTDPGEIEEFEMPPTIRVVQEILTERERQKHREGWTLEHDDGHEQGELAQAAAMYALHEPSIHARIPVPRLVTRGGVPMWWPWEPGWWKPRSHRENLVRAGALIVAEIERLDRAAEPEGG